MDELTELAEEWALTLSAVSDQTKIVYARSVNQFLAYLTTHHPRLSDGAAMTRKHVDGWMTELAGKGRSEGANEGDVERLAGWRSPMMVRRSGA